MPPWAAEGSYYMNGYVFQVLGFFCLDFVCFPQRNRFYLAVQNKDCLFMILISSLYIYLFNPYYKLGPTQATEIWLWVKEPMTLVLYSSHFNEMR